MQLTANDFGKILDAEVAAGNVNQAHFLRWHVGRVLATVRKKLPQDLINEVAELPLPSPEAGPQRSAGNSR